MLGTGNDGVALVAFDDYFSFYIMLCDKQEVNNWCVSGNIEGENVIPLQSMPCYEESLKDSEFEKIKTQLEQKFEDIGESLEDYSNEPRKFYAGANVTMVCKL